MVNCKECNNEFESIDSLRRHRSQKHGVSAEQTYIDYNLGGITPKCECGCSEKPKYMGIEAGFRKYIRGHASRVNNNWGHNSDVVKKSHDVQREMFKNGELVIWNKGLDINDSRVRDNIDKIMGNPERGNNISKKLKGTPKSNVHKKNISESSTIRWENQDERDKQSIRLIKRLILNNHRNKKTKLEINFQHLLESISLKEGVDFKYQHQVSSAIFDFYIIYKNILIEVDGDFHHCNPNSKHKIPIYPIQLKTVGNDIRKNRISDNHNYKLLRFWESDINNNPAEVIKILKQELNII